MQVFYIYRFKTAYHKKIQTANMATDERNSSLLILSYAITKLRKHITKRKCTMSSNKHLILDPLVQSFLNSLQGGTPLYTLTPVEARKVLDTLQAKPVQKLPADIEDLTIPGGPKGDISLRIVRPQGRKEKLPVVLFIHGGGWVLGNKETHDRLIREIANGAEAAVVFVDYTPAPEGQYPVAHEEGYAAAQWIAKNGESHALDTSRIAIAGDSVGGLMATAIAMMVKERGGPKFLFQLLFYPVTDANFETDSYKEFAQGYYLDRKAMIWFWDNYVPNKEQRANPLASPLQATIEQLKNLPPALIIVHEADVLRDEGEAYGRKLFQAGVPTALIRLDGIIHDSAMLNAITNAPAVRLAIAAANHSLKQAFKK